jgi:hypothetical protein
MGRPCVCPVMANPPRDPKLAGPTREDKAMLVRKWIVGLAAMVVGLDHRECDQ